MYEMIFCICDEFNLLLPLFDQPAGLCNSYLCLCRALMIFLLTLFLCMLTMDGPNGSGVTCCSLFPSAAGLQLPYGSNQSTDPEQGFK